ncbi:hypothetical protein [Enterococcus faecalis]|uniref:hypothetical protein n=1 Tax=Enterococcus faecalis TaxID=1351 RepID=UPI00200DB061|nr:hypothetical protein [Enterococcus faecalis]MCU2256649.1 hypothetical protein [Enterococcus faecalis]UQF26367.1 hypothetical protein M2924_04085 [Enterococcus faecalis]UQF57316.1 hypothetical protein M2910_04080 [Enterococcus faecalis]UQR18738.1 hypothetical protein LQ046_04085 [Enterococcus faecalis]WCG40765.1 hypothetical protein PML75_04090 [Enterococcus faecalis]
MCVHQEEIEKALMDKQSQLTFEELMKELGLVEENKNKLIILSLLRNNNKVEVTYTKRNKKVITLFKMKKI